MAADEVSDDFDPAPLGHREALPVPHLAPALPGAAAAPDALGGLQRRSTSSAMRAAASALLGTHDFSSFRAADCEAPHARRTLRELELHDGGRDAAHRGGGDGVPQAHGAEHRRLAGRGRPRQAPAGWVAEVLAAKDRTLAGPTAPAHGLTLVEVTYGAGPRQAEPPHVARVAVTGTSARELPGLLRRRGNDCRCRAPGERVPRAAVPVVVNDAPLAARGGPRGAPGGGPPRRESPDRAGIPPPAPARGRPSRSAGSGGRRDVALEGQGAAADDHLGAPGMT